MSACGHFFLIDVPTFDAICQLGHPDAAAAYLILAAGTGPDNMTSSWGRDAVAKRTALNWRRADACTTKLEQHGFLRWIEKSSRKTRLLLPVLETRHPLSPRRAAIVKKIAAGGQPESGAELAAAQEAEGLGWLHVDETGDWRSIATRPMQPAYLPISLIGDEMGRVTSETSIVERVRKARDAMAFHLLIHMYRLQDLAEHGGVDPYALYQMGERGLVVSTAQFDVLQFANLRSWVRWTDDMLPHRRDTEAPGDDLFKRLAVLEDAGAVEWSLVMAEDDKRDALPIYPAALLRFGKIVPDAPESIVGAYALAAACALAGKPDVLDSWAHAASASFVLPVDRMNRHATLIGIPRLRGRARTRNAQRWTADLHRIAREWIAVFRGIIAEHAVELLEPLDRRFADFNGDFNVDLNESSTLLQRDINDSSQSAMHEFRPSDGDDQDFGDWNSDWADAI